MKLKNWYNSKDYIYKLGLCLTTTLKFYSVCVREKESFVGGEWNFGKQGGQSSKEEEFQSPSV